MDIQQQRFELAIKEAFPNSPQYLNKNPDGTYRNTTTFGAWIGWKLAAKAQSVPEGFVLVPKEPTSEVLKAISAEIVKPNNGRIFLAKVYKAMIEPQEPK